MKTRWYAVARIWCLWFLTLLIVLSVVLSLLAQESSPGTSPEQKDPNTWKALKDKLAGLVQKHPLIAVVVFIVGVALALLKDVIKTVIKDILKPLVAKLITRLLIRFGRYSSLLKKYQQTLQRNLREGDSHGSLSERALIWRRITSRYSSAGRSIGTRRRFPLLVRPIKLTKKGNFHKSRKRHSMIELMWEKF